MQPDQRRAKLCLAFDTELSGGAGGDGQASVAEEEGQRLQQMMAGALKLQVPMPEGLCRMLLLGCL